MGKKSNTEVVEDGDNNETQTHIQLSDRKQALLRSSMFLGGKKPITASEFVPSENVFVKQDVTYSPAALKCIDEAIVNAVDQYTRNGKTDIWIAFDKDGTVTVKNDGGSVPVEKCKTHDGRTMYKPQMVFGEYRTSSTYTTAASKTGGTFGYGIKLTNTFSTVFELENYDAKRGIVYKQRWLKEKSEDTLYCDEPVLETAPRASDRQGYTQVKFLLDWTEFDMNPDNLVELEKLTYMRAVHSSVFLGSPSRVFFQNTEITVKSLSAMAGLFLEPLYPADAAVSKVDMVVPTIDTALDPWQVSIGVKPDTESKFETLSIINGVYVKSGSHFGYLEKAILKYLKPKVESLYKKAGVTKKFNKQNILKYLMVFMQGHINNPEYTGQRKDVLDLQESQFKSYALPEAKLEQVWLLLQSYIDDDIIDLAPAKKKKAKVKAKKYNSAKMAGTKDSSSCSLFVAEGDSAVGMIDQAIASGCSKYLNRDYYGTYSIQGVPMNPRKQITIRTTAGRTLKIPSDRLKKNERLSVLEQILGLDKNHDFDKLEDVHKQLRYGHVIIASDQDEDGKGNIRSQTLNFFQTFWPKLVGLGYVQFINTPIMRVIPRSSKGYIEEFYTEKQYLQWATRMGSSAKNYDTKYYKGLGTHNKDDVKDMFSNWPYILMTYFSDKRSERAMEVYFGKNSDLRKAVLVLPPQGEEDRFYVDNRLSVTDHLNTATRQYQLYNIGRHIQHCLDGQTPSKRKVIAASRSHFNHNNQTLKVYQLGGIVAKEMNYHHGDASLGETIIRMAQCFVGAREFPLLQEESNFGSRAKGGTDAAAPRYADLKMNKVLMNALFPKLDDCNLEYVYDDGKRCEPKFYVPIVPLAILESYSSPATGWASTIWGRDYIEVSAHLHRCIDAGNYIQLDKKDFSINDYRYSHKLVDLGGIPNSLGTYVEDDTDRITVTELPMRVWNEHWIKGNPEKKDSVGIEDLPEVANVYDVSSDDNGIQIEIEFKKGGLELAKEKGAKNATMAKHGIDPLISYLDLKQSLKDNICLIDINGAVCEHTTYVDVFQKWFDIRKDYYRMRVERTSILLRLNILMLENQIEFVKQRDNYNLKVPRAEQVTLLQSKKYQTIDKHKLQVADFIKTADLTHTIKEGDGADYGYLTKMNSEDISDEALLQLQEKLKECKSDLEELLKQDHFPGARIWKKELTQLDAAVSKYRESGTWTYGEKKPKRRTKQ